ncbi:hypothetical protein LG3211_1084 [Lysobacter gummosus]|nr:hypothetical protein LG3211_1084 [Lysobacter gummosus]
MRHGRWAKCVDAGPRETSRCIGPVRGWATPRRRKVRRL